MKEILAYYLNTLKCLPNKRDKLKNRIDRIGSKELNNLFDYGDRLNDDHDNKDNIFTLLDLAANKAQKTSVDEFNTLNNLLDCTKKYLTGDVTRKNLDDIRILASKLDSPHTLMPYWLKVMIGIVFLMLTIALVLSVAALVISLTGGSAAIALIAPAVALAKPVIDVLAATSIVAAASTTIGITATTGATAALAGAGAIGAAVTGRLSFFFMHRPFTDCVEKIIQIKKDQYKETIRQGFFAV